MGPRSQILSFEVLHAYVAGEVDPAERAAIEAQLEVCEESRARLAQVQGMQGLFADMAAPEPDDLAWQRMQRRVAAALEEDASDRLRAPGVGGLWVPIAVAAAAVIATLVALGPRPEPKPENATASPQVLASGAAPLEVTLASGTSLHLAPKSEVVVRSPSLPTKLELEVGELDVRAPQQTHDGEPVVWVKTPAYEAGASSKDFTVAYRADRYFVEARDGAVAVKGQGFDDGTIVRAGERRTVKQKKTERRPSRVEQLLEASLEKAKKQEPPTLRTTSEGETRVQLVLDEKDPIKRKWVQAARAYYEGRDLERAVALAREVVQEAPDRPEARMAEGLLCEALIATKRGREAISACEARLKRPQSDEERREIHFLLGTIHHKLLRDCAQAIPHYGQAMVFGSQSLMDDRVRLFRAECALEVGDVELARSDVEAVKNRRERLPNPEELDRLQTRIAEAMGGRGK